MIPVSSIQFYIGHNKKNIQITLHIVWTVLHEWFRCYLVHMKKRVLYYCIRRLTPLCLPNEVWRHIVFAPFLLIIIRSFHLSEERPLVIVMFIIRSFHVSMERPLVIVLFIIFIIIIFLSFRHFYFLSQIFILPHNIFLLCILYRL